MLESRRVSKLGFILEIDIICLYAAVIFEQGECAELLSKVFMREKLHGHLLFLVKSWQREQRLQMDPDPPMEESEKRECWDWDIFWQVGCGSWVLAGEISQAPKGSLEQREKLLGLDYSQHFTGRQPWVLLFCSQSGSLTLFSFIHTWEEQRERNTKCVCNFSGSNIPPKKHSSFRSCGTSLIHKMSTNSRAGSQTGFPFTSRWRTSAEGVCSVFQSFGCTCSPKGLFTSWKCFVCSSPVLSPRPPALLYPPGMWLPQQLPDGESVFEMAVDPTHCLGMQAKAFYWIEELTQSQERRVKLWKLPQQVRHWVRCVATWFPGRGCALSLVWWQFLSQGPDHCGFLWEATWAAPVKTAPLALTDVVQMFGKSSF